MSESFRTIEWNVDKLTKFKARYMVAVAKEEEIITFEKNKFVVDYAKYMIQFLDAELSK